jgi:hypothetical protein
MNIEAEKTTVFLIRLTLGEALAVLTDPAPLQKEIRALLPPKTGRPARTGATLSLSKGRVAHPKARPPQAGGDKVPCPVCGKMMRKTSLWAHKRKMHAAPAAG